MSIQLPRNQKELHFTGSVKALSLEEDAPRPALGQQRPKAVPTPPPSRTPAPARIPTARGQLVSMDDDQVTEALDRDIVNAALFPVARRENAAAAPLNLPVPHFRSAAEARAHHAPPAVIVRRPSSSGLPLSVWLIAALISGIVSYQLAPQAVASVTQAVRGSDAR